MVLASGRSRLDNVSVSRRRAPPILGGIFSLVLVIGVVTAVFSGVFAGGRAASASVDPVIAAAGDIACDPANSNFNGGNGKNGACQQLATYNVLQQVNAAAVLALGDNQYYCGGYQAFQQSYALSWGHLLSETYPSVGNHEFLTSGGTGCDSSNAGAAGYYRYYAGAAAEGNVGQGWYSFDLGGWHLIALNSNCSQAGGCGTGSPQYNWLASDLAAHANQCLLAYWHIPLFSSGGRANNNSHSFWNLLYAAHADVVLNGHDHIYERFAPQNPSGQLDTAQGIREFIVGTGGANHTSIVAPAANSEVRFATTFGVLEMTLHPGSYDWAFVPVGGQPVMDSGSGTCHHGGSAPGDTTPPSVPAGLTAKPISSSEIDLSWSPSTDSGGSGLKGYNVYDGGTLIASPTGTSYASTGLAAGSTHTYTVSAVDNAGNESAGSTPATAVTPSGGTGGGIAFVRQVTANVASSSTLTVPLGGGTTAGDGLVAAVALKAGSSASVSSVSDSGGGAWTRGAVGFLTGTNSRVELWYRLGAPTLTSVTVTLSSAKSASADVSEWSGLASAVDAAAGGSNASAATAGTPAITTSNPYDLVIGAVNYPNAVSSTLTSGAFKPLADFGYSTTVHGRASYSLSSTTGSTNATWTLSGPSGGAGGAILALGGLGPPQLTKAPQVSGHAVVGRRLLASHGRWTGRPKTYRYQWLRCNAKGRSCVRIRRAVRSSYRIKRHDTGHRLRIRVMAVNAAGSRLATSRATGHVAPAA
jgi:calcineurin-like phosphoesterase family protein/fibronectin type III domain protein